MTIDTNDPRLTAYALGEMNEDERAAFAREIDGDEDLLAEIAEIALLADVLGAEFGAEGDEGPSLSDAERDSIFARLDLAPSLEAEEEVAMANIVSLPAKKRHPDTLDFAGSTKPKAETPREGRAPSTPSGADEEPGKVVAFPAWKIGTLVAMAAAVLLVASAGLLTFTKGDEEPQLQQGVESPPVVLDPVVTESEVQPAGAEEKPKVTLEIVNTDGDLIASSDKSQHEGLAMDIPGSDEGGRFGQAGTPKKPTTPPADTTTITNGTTASTKSKEDHRAELLAWARKKELTGDRLVAANESLKYGGSQDYGYLADKDRVSPAPQPAPAGGRSEDYATVVENDFIDVSSKPLSTFSIDVDTASYSNVRRFLQRGVRPPVDAVRVEELINYFDYGYAPPSDETPFAVHLESATSPFNSARKIVRVGLKGKEIHKQQRPVSNLVFLLDVSGSMSAPNKLPLLKQSLSMLVDQLSEKDRVAIVVYAGASGVVLPSTSADQKATIKSALERLNSGGSTNGGAGIELAYRLAVENFAEGGTNRVILATDGDFNVGATSNADLQELIARKAKSGVFLSVLGFGMGNLSDRTLETLADKGNGNYAYIDTLAESKKVLVDQLSGTLVTIAKDVKIQVEFNPARISSYRLIGYSNRLLAARDFADDTKDAGEIGAGHTVTALYEVVPANTPAPGDPSLKYQERPKLTDAAHQGELLTVKLRYKEPEGHTSELLTFPLEDNDQTLSQASADLRFALSVAAYGQLLSGSSHSGDIGWDEVRRLAESARGRDPHGYRAEFLQLDNKASALVPAVDTSSKQKDDVAENAGEYGYLSISARPWAEVYINGIPIGVKTPIRRKALSPGDYTVKVVFPSMNGRSKSKRVTISAGQNAVVFFTL